MRSLAIDQSLEGIAGPPLAMLTVPNTTSNPLNIGPTEARTLYAVASTTALSSGTGIANIGANVNSSNAFEGAQIIRSGEKGAGGFVHRSQAIGGALVIQNVLKGWPWNTPLAVCGWWDGSVFGSQGYGSAVIVSAPATGLSMNSTPPLRLAPMWSGGTTPIAALAYRGAHDLNTRTRILGWLMQRYGSL